MSETTGQEQPRTVVVPVANPKTAVELLHLAADLVHSEEGKVKALMVSLGNAEGDDQSINELDPICEKMIANGHPVELLTRTSTSIARGILDTARELGADLILLGLQQPKHGDVILGTVVENVLAAAPTDVIVYRDSQHGEFDRVLVPVDDYSHARAAIQTGIWLARRRSIDIEAIYARRSGMSYYDGLARIEAALYEQPHQRQVKRTVVMAQDGPQAVLSRVEQDDLIVVGFDARGEMERWLFAGVSNAILNEARGPVLVVARSMDAERSVTRFGRRALNWLRPVLTRVEAEEIARQSSANASISLDYVILILISAIIAALGLLINSSAVIIGAMLVAPLMQPLISYSTGLTVGNFAMMGRSLLTLVIGILMALFVSYFIGLIAPTTIPTSEMLIRGQPSPLDGFVALASGFVGAYATARKDIPAALAGVAIAAALMPPIGTIGLSYALGEIDLALGSSLLFITNIVCIILAASIVFFWLGMHHHIAGQRSLLRQGISITLAIALTLFVMFELNELNNRVTDESFIREQLEQILEADELVDLSVQTSGDVTQITATLRVQRIRSRSDYAAMQAQLAEALEKPVRFDVIPQRMIRIPPPVDEPDE